MGALLELTRCSAAVRALDAKMCATVTANTWIAIPCVSVAEKFVFAYMGLDATVDFGRMLGESVAAENRDSASTSVGIAQMTGYRVVYRCGGWSEAARGSGRLAIL